MQFYSIKHVSGDLESLKRVVWHSGQNSSNSNLLIKLQAIVAKTLLQNTYFTHLQNAYF